MAGTVPFVADEEDEDDPANALYSGPQRDDEESNDDDANTGAQPSTGAGKFGPSGSGKDGGGSSKMPGPSASVSDDKDEQMLVAPKYTAPDRSGVNAAQAKLTTDSAAINKADYKPKWYERLLGGVAAGLSGDVEGGQAVVNRRYNAAADQQKRNVAADTTALAAEQGKVGAGDQDFEHNMQSFRGQVAAENANSLKGERAAKAEKYDAAIDPQSIHEKEDGSWEGTTYGGKTVPAAMPKYAAKKPPPTPKTYEELVAASRDPQYSPAQQKAYGDSAKEIQGTEVKKFKTTAPRATAEEIEYNDWKSAFQRDNGRAPTAAELEQHRANARSSGGGAGKSKRSIDDAAAKEYSKVETDIDNGVLSDPKEIQKRKQAVEDQRHQDMQDIGQPHTRFVYDDANKGHNEAPNRAAAAPAGGNGPAKFQAPKSGHQLAVGQQVNVPGKGMRYVTGYVNGKVQVDTKPPKSQPGA